MYYELSLLLWCFHTLLNPVPISTIYLPEGNDGILTVQSVTTTSVTLKWEFDHNISDGTILMATVESRALVDTPAKLEWDWSAGHFSAEHAYRPRKRIFRWYLDNAQAFTQDANANLALIAVNDLRYPGTDYDFNLQKTVMGETSARTMRAKITVRTKDALPTYAPKAGVGCFHVYEADEISRKVKIYWQPVHGRYEFCVYEEGQLEPIYVETGDSERGYTLCIISLKRHRVILKSISEVGVSEKFSTIDIPPQDEINSLPQFPIHWNYTKNSFRISWEKPENVKITNYTIFWADTVDKQAALRIADFVYVRDDENWFEVKGEPWVELGLSVNTATSSSGLRIARLS